MISFKDTENNGEQAYDEYINLVSEDRDSQVIIFMNNLTQSFYFNYDLHQKDYLCMKTH